MHPSSLIWVHFHILHPHHWTNNPLQKPWHLQRSPFHTPGCWDQSLLCLCSHSFWVLCGAMLSYFRRDNRWETNVIKLILVLTKYSSGTWLTTWFNILAVAFFLVFQIPNVRFKNAICSHDFLTPGRDKMAELHPGPQCALAPAPLTSSKGAVQERGSGWMCLKQYSKMCS